MAVDLSTAEQDTEELLALYDEMFKTRYTEEDTEYMATVNTPTPPPPCIRNWFQKNRGNFRNRGGYQDRRGGRYHDSRNREGHDYRDDNRGYRDGNRGYRDDQRGYRDDNRGYRGSDRDRSNYGGHNRDHYHDNRYSGGYRDRDQR